MKTFGMLAVVAMFGAPALMAGGHGCSDHSHSYSSRSGFSKVRAEVVRESCHTETRVVEEIIPAHYEYVEREVWVPCWDEVVCENVWIPGHYDECIKTVRVCGAEVRRTEKVWVDGYFETQDRVVHHEGYSKTVIEQVYVPARTICHRVPVTHCCR